MTTPQPNHQKLLITGKGKSNSISGTDGRIIEQWANEGIVRKINAGTNITTDPANGVDMGQGITINATGGGSGISADFFVMTAGPDAVDFGTPSPYGIVFGPLSWGGGVLFQSTWPVLSNDGSRLTNVYYSLASSWLWDIFSGDSACVLPEIDAPTWTGPDIGIAATIQALAFDESDEAIYQTSGMTISSGASFQFTAADFTNVIQNGSGGLVLTAGSGPHGNGLVSTGGNVYFGATNITLDVVAGVSFT
jgi:hypothetical protein